MGRPTSRRALALAATLALGLFVGSLVGGTAMANHQFSDVGNNNQFHGDIEWMVEHDIANGFEDGTYRPAAPVSRQAIAAFMSRLIGTFRTVSHTEDPPLASTWTVTATCAADEEPMGGGGRIDFAGIYMTESVPGLHNWTVVFESEANTPMNPTAMTAWVTCVPTPTSKLPA